MVKSASQPGIFLGRITRQDIPCRAHFHLSVAVDGFPAAEPGQFVHVRCARPIAPQRTASPQPHESAPSAAWIRPFSNSPLLRRPFSIAGLRRQGDVCEIDLLGRAVGPGTTWLAALQPGDLLDVLGPLGNAFTPPQPGQHALLVAGGVGLPPIRWLGERLRHAGISCDALYGALTRTLLPVTLLHEPSASGALTSCAEEFARDGIAAAITTDDGSCGLRGRVTDVLARYLNDRQDAASLAVYACGPHAMLREVAALCLARSLDCELALERRMGCGMGTCQSCVVKVVDAAGSQGWRYALSCTEGPVFKASSLVWN